MGISSFTITNKDPKALEFALLQAANEGWNPGLHDHAPFYAADPKGYFIGYLDNKPIACASAVCYSPDFAFFGLYIVMPEYRGQGYGMAITKECLTTIGERNCGLDSVIENQSVYEKIGFQTDFITQRYKILWEQRPLNVAIEHLKPLNQISPQSLERYDQDFFPAPRMEFLKAWISQPGHVGVAFVKEKMVLGYGVIRPCLEGYKIGPLFANNPDIAAQILHFLLSKTPTASIFIDVPNPNPIGKDILSHFNPQPVFACARMYTKQAPKLPLDKIFALTSFELG
jgi:GNAT superfamily N-acetyltransferase